MESKGDKKREGREERGKEWEGVRGRRRNKRERERYGGRRDVWAFLCEHSSLFVVEQIPTLTDQLGEATGRLQY